MQNSKKIIIISTAIALILIAVATLLIFLNKKEDKEKEKNITIDEASIKANNLYKTENTDIEMEENNNCYIAIVRDISTQEILNEFCIDKKNGQVKEIGRPSKEANPTIGY